MDANESLNNFDYEGFITREFSYPEGKFPDITRLLGHFDKITKLLLECGIQSLKVAKNYQGVSAYHANTCYTIVCNFRGDFSKSNHSVLVQIVQPTFCL